MPNFSINFATNTQQTLNGEMGFVGRQGQITSLNNTPAVDMNNNAHLTVAGSVFAVNDAVDADGSFIDIVVAETGTISGRSDAIEGLASSQLNVVNKGLISGGDGNGVFADETTGTTGVFYLLNEGTVRGWSFGVRSGMGDQTTITNTGTIQGDNSDAIDVFDGDLTLSNLGTIVSPSQTNGDYAIDFSGDQANVVNEGHIVGDVRLSNLTNSNDFYDGRLGTHTSASGLPPTIAGQAGNDTLLGGASNESIGGGSGDDILYGGGGTDILSGGPGNDTYILDETSNEVLILDSSGTDTVRSSVTHRLVSSIENLTLNGTDAIDGIGNSSDNVIRGNEADNRIIGGVGLDDLSGGAGDDSIAGGNNNDLINGDEGNDILSGGRGGDVIIGGDGNDLIAGNEGRDTLTGDFGPFGGGRDQFRFFSVEDSPFPTADFITDFIVGEDTIDLRPIDADSTTGRNDAFDFIGTTGFSGTAGELRVIYGATATFIDGDTDGNGLTDFRIILQNGADIVEGDFLL